MRVQLDNKYTNPNQNSTANNNGLISQLVSGEITIEYETAYWLVIACFLLIAAINIYNYIEQMKNGKMEISDGLYAG
jgi:hypothetical protein